MNIAMSVLLMCFSTSVSLFAALIGGGGVDSVKIFQHLEPGQRHTHIDKSPHVDRSTCILLLCHPVDRYL